MTIGKPGEKGEIPVGVIVGSVIGGLLLLAIATAVLWKVEFSPFCLFSVCLCLCKCVLKSAGHKVNKYVQNTVLIFRLIVFCNFGIAEKSMHFKFKTKIKYVVVPPAWVL